MITSILDTDLYKLTMQQAIAHHYSRVEAEYEFINRANTPFPDGFGETLRTWVRRMRNLTLLPDEEDFLRDQCYYLRPSYIDLLRGYRYDPRQVRIEQDGSILSVKVRGPWYLTVLWEVPLLAMISELFYKITERKLTDDKWQHRLHAKYEKMTEAGCIVSDFGTRRRFSYEVQDYAVLALKRYSCGAGTSNVHLAHKHGLKPIGTMAHEWVMGHACLFGYRRATIEMLRAWVEVYGGELGVALPDTFTTPFFLTDFDVLHAKLFDGVRWDSGDWKNFTDMVVNHWKFLRIDPRTKVIVYSDSLTDERAIEIQRYAEDKVLPRFGIGTFLTNDVGFQPLNIVIKLTRCDGYPAVKLSDSLGKELGSAQEVAHCKQNLGMRV